MVWNDEEIVLSIFLIFIFLLILLYYKRRWRKQTNRVPSQETIIIDASRNPVTNNRPIIIVEFVDSEDEGSNGDANNENDVGNNRIEKFKVDRVNLAPDAPPRYEEVVNLH